LVTPVPLSPLLLLCCAYGGGSIKISLQAMPYTSVFLAVTSTAHISKLATGIHDFTWLPVWFGELVTPGTYLQFFCEISCGRVLQIPNYYYVGPFTVYTHLSLHNSAYFWGQNKQKLLRMVFCLRQIPSTIGGHGHCIIWE
jgi:hypothetical protein